MNLGWKTGRGFAPPRNGLRGWWFIWGWFGLELTPSRWRIGLGVSAWIFAVMLGPLTVRIGSSTLRWRVWPATGSALTGDTWQDYRWTITVETDTSNTTTEPRDE